MNRKNDEGGKTLRDAIEMVGVSNGDLLVFYFTNL